jgi:hypothetical protein
MMLQRVTSADSGTESEVKARIRSQKVQPDKDSRQLPFAIQGS